MPKGGKPTMCVCEECKCSFKKKFQGNTTNRFCCRKCRDDFVAKAKIKSGKYNKWTALSYFKRFTEYHCSECGIDEYNKMPLTLQIDHIDGNRRNNKVTNLRYLCPNCHSQTPTWGHRNVSEKGKQRRNSVLPKGRLFQR